MQNDLFGKKIKIERDGEYIECDVIFTFDCEETNKSYIGYTDNSIAQNGRKNIFVSSYNPLDLNEELKDVEDERELKMIQDVLRKYDEDANK